MRNFFVSNRSISTAKAPLQPLKPTRPLELVTTDLTGPLPKSKRGNKYILVICDHFTKWVQLHALKTHTADKVARCLLSYCTTFGIPDKLLTDQGTDFESMLIAELMDLFDTKKLRTSPYHPETDGLTERFNQTLKIMLTNFVNDAQDNWDELLEQLAFAYNTAEHAIHEHTPFELMYGRIPKIPIDIFYQPRTQSGEIIANENEFVEKFVNNQKVFFQKAYNAVHALRDMKVNKTKIRYDRTTRKEKYGVGDLVLVREGKTTKKKSKKLTFKWNGPFSVIECVGEVTYKLKSVPTLSNTKSGKRIYTRRIVRHFNQLRKYKGSLKEVEPEESPLPLKRTRKRVLRIDSDSEEETTNASTTKRRGRPKKSAKPLQPAQLTIQQGQDSQTGGNEGEKDVSDREDTQKTSATPAQPPESEAQQPDQPNKTSEELVTQAAQEAVVHPEEIREKIIEIIAHKPVKNSYHFQSKLETGAIEWLPKIRVIDTEALVEFAKTLTTTEIRKLKIQELIPKSRIIAD